MLRSSKGGPNKGEATRRSVEPGIRKWEPVLLPFAVGLLGTMASSLLAVYSGLWTSVPGTLYCIPIVIAAIALGARSAMMVALAAGGVQLLAAGFNNGSAWIASIAETVLFVCVAL